MVTSFEVWASNLGPDPLLPRSGGVRSNGPLFGIVCHGYRGIP